MRKLIHNDEEVIYIEYVDGLPLQVLTAPLDGGLTWFDFEFVYGDRKDIRYYEAGAGGKRNEIQAPHFVSPEGKKYWMAPGCKFKGRSKAKNCTRIEKPLRIKGYFHSSINPFKAADETSYGFEYCEDCDQYSCDGEGCPNHQHWDDEKSMLVYNKDGLPVE